MKIIEGINVTKYFGGVRALNNVNFCIGNCEIVGLIGPNGSGKTTLFNIISGHIAPTKGKIIFRGMDITNLKPYKICRMGIARTFQTPKPFLRMTVYENILVPIVFTGRRKKEKRMDKEEITRLLEKFNLITKISAPASELTLYEQRLLELARALACKPNLLLLDEVMAGLNPAETAQIVKILKELREYDSMTLFIIEHNLHAVMRLADRIIVLNQGEIIAEGKPEEISSDFRVIEAYLGEKYDFKS